MATLLLESAVGFEDRTSGRPLTICHFTTVHTELKSRSFHRQMMPLAARGMKIRYLAPLKAGAQVGGVELIAVPRRKNRVRRLLAVPLLLPALLEQKADLYHFQDTELLPLALVLKLIFRRRVIYDAYEDFPAMVANKKSIPRVIRPIAARIVSLAERLAALAFDGVMTADPLTLRRLAKVGASKKLVLYNFPNLGLFAAPTPRAKQFDVVYRGGLSERAGTYVLLDAMRILAAHGRRVRLLLMGYFDDPIAEKRLRERIRESGLESSTVIRGRIDHDFMADALSEARIGVCPLQRVPKFVRNIPVKVFEYWACAMPVVASDLPPIMPFFHPAEAGLLCSADRPDEWARAIARLLDDPQLATRMGQRGRDLVVQRLNNGLEIRKLQRFCTEIAARDFPAREDISREATSHA
jgi:glycosyltransferase involved in cell wall biosynthesis